MRSLVYLGPNQLEVQEKEVLEPKKGEVRLKIEACGICGSDVHGYLGLTGRRTPPMTMGHEFAGVVEKVGEGVTNVKAGDRVYSFPVSWCGECEECRKGNYSACINRIQYGVLENDGAFAESLCVDAKGCLKLPDNLSFEEGALAEPLAVSHKAVRQLGDLTGKSVFISGAGTIGLFALACVKASGASKILVADLNNERLAIARMVGADYTINPKEEDFDEKVSKLTEGAGFDCSIEAVGATPTCQQSIAALKKGGHAIWIGNNAPSVEINMIKVVTREINIQGTFLYEMEDFKGAVDLISRKTFDFTKLISDRITLEEAPAMFAELAKGPSGKIKVMVEPQRK